MDQVFLSHSSKDSTKSRELYDNLMKLGFKVWFDEVELEPGDCLIGKIGNSIQASNIPAVILSENSVKSNWVQKEISVAQAGQLEGGKMRVVPIRIDHCAIPAFLRDIRYVDFREDQNRPYEFGKLVKMLLRPDAQEATLLRLVSNSAEVSANDQHNEKYPPGRVLTSSDEIGPNASRDYWLTSNDKRAILTLKLQRTYRLRLIRILNTQNGEANDRGTQRAKLNFAAPETEAFTVWEGAIPLHPEWLSLSFDSIPAERVVLHVLGWHGKGGGLNCIEVYAED